MICDTMDVQISRIALIRADFFWNECLVLDEKKIKKSLRISAIREICTSIRIIIFLK